MADTVRTIAYILANLLQDGQSPGSITAQDIRDLTVSLQALIQTEAGTTTTGNYTFALADLGSVKEATDATAVTYTIPPNSSVAFPVGAEIAVCQYGAGQVTLAAGGGVTLRTPSSRTTRAQYSTIGIRQRATDEWVLAGDLT